MGVAPRVQHYFWSVGGPGPAKPPGQGAYILEWAKEVSDMKSPPLITSHSYGDTEQGGSGVYGLESLFASCFYVPQSSSSFACDWQF
jgi:hypothetical protein